jgi:hypothetical protein
MELTPIAFIGTSNNTAPRLQDRRSQHVDLRNGAAGKLTATGSTLNAESAPAGLNRSLPEPPAASAGADAPIPSPSDALPPLALPPVGAPAPAPAPVSPPSPASPLDPEDPPALPSPITPAEGSDQASSGTGADDNSNCKPHFFPEYYFTHISNTKVANTQT